MSGAVRLLGAGDIRDIAGRLGVHPTKKLGQNFVVEPGTVRQIAALAAVQPGDVILEVGPGLGSLTLALLAWAGSLAVWHLAVASFVNGIGWAADNPVRRTLIGDVRK